MNQYMYAALQEARKGIMNGHGGPFGAVIVKDGDIIAKAHNKVVKNKDCTCHAEMEAIRSACKALGSFDLSECDVYTTSEPCPMCKGAIQWARIRKVYYGCDVKDAENIGFKDKEFFENSIPSEELDKQDCLELFDIYNKSNHVSY